MEEEEKSLIPSKPTASLNRIGDYGTNMVSIVLAGTQFPIRRLENDVPLIALMQGIAEAYGAREGLTDNTIRECLSVLKRFGMLGVEEVKEAFRMSAAGELKVGVDVYGGVWNAGIVGRVLGAYREHRRKVLAAVIKSEQNMAKEARTARLQADEKNTKLYADFMGMVEEKGGKYQSWREVPSFWYGIAMKLGLIVFEGDEAQRIYEWAIVAAKSEMQREVSGAATVIERKGYQSMLDAFEQGNMGRAKTISRKVSVWVKLLGGDFSKL